MFCEGVLYSSFSQDCVSPPVLTSSLPLPLFSLCSLLCVSSRSLTARPLSLGNVALGLKGEQAGQAKLDLLSGALQLLKRFALLYRKHDGTNHSGRSHGETRLDP